MHLDVWVYIRVEGLTDYIAAQHKFSRDFWKKWKILRGYASDLNNNIFDVNPEGKLIKQECPKLLYYYRRLTWNINHKVEII